MQRYKAKAAILTLTILLAVSSASSQVPELSSNSTVSYDRFKDESVVSDIITMRTIVISNDLVSYYRLASNQMSLTVKAYAAYSGKTPRAGGLRKLVLETSFLNYPGDMPSGETKAYLLAGEKRFGAVGVLSVTPMVRTPAGVSKNLGIGSAILILTQLGHEAMKAMYEADKTEMKVIDIELNLSESNGTQNFRRFYDYVTARKPPK